IGIALDVDDVGLLTFGAIALRIHDDAARNRAVRAGIAGLGGAHELERPDRIRIGGFDLSEPERSETCPGNTRASALHELAPREFDVHRWSLLSRSCPQRGTLSLGH